MAKRNQLIPLRFKGLNDTQITTNLCNHYTSKAKAWFRGLLHHPARKWIRPILQLPGSTRGKCDMTATATAQLLRQWTFTDNAASIPTDTYTTDWGHPALTLQKNTIIRAFIPVNCVHDIKAHSRNS